MAGTKSKLIFRIIVVIFVLILIIASAFSWFITYKKATTVLPPTVQSVSAIEVTAGNFNGNYEASGFVKASESGDLYFLSAGKVDKIFVKPGQHVVKGQQIAQLDISAEVAAINAQRANLAALRQNYEGLAAVQKVGGASTLQVSQALGQLNQLNSSIQSAQDALKTKVITAPFNGVIGSIAVNVGDLVNNTVKVATIMNEADAGKDKYVNVSISTDVIDHLSVGNPVIAYDKDNNKVAEGTITSLDDSINSATGTSSLRVTFPSDQSAALHNGEFVKLSLGANTLENQITVPEVSVVYSLYGQTVYVLQPLSEEDKAKLAPLTADLDDKAKATFFNGIYKAKETFVKSNDHTDDVALVTDGLKVGDIIVTNYNQLSDGTYVKIAPGYGLGVPDTFKLPAAAMQKGVQQSQPNDADSNSDE